MSNYQIDTESARAVDQMGNRIKETGKYIGVLTRAEEVKSRNGTLGVEFSYKTDDGMTADYLTLWTKNKDGKELFGLKQLMAIMTCCRVRAITTVRGTVEKYNTAIGLVGVMDAEVFPELTGKRVGLLLQREEYEKADGSIGSKMSIMAPFEADTELTASEVLDKATTPEKLQVMVAGLRDKPLIASGGGATAAQHGTASAAGFADDGDDIPF